MSDLIKVSNPNEFNVGIKLMDGIQERNIRGNSFTYLDEKEIYFIDSICSLFKRGILIIDSDEINSNLGLTEVKDGVNDENLEKILKGNVMKMKAEMKKITEKHVIDKVIQLAVKLDLPASKLKILEEVFKINIVDTLTESETKE